MGGRNGREGGREVEQGREGGEEHPMPATHDRSLAMTQASMYISINCTLALILRHLILNLIHS